MWEHLVARAAAELGARADLTIVGCGLRSYLQMTIESCAHVRRARVVVYPALSANIDETPGPVGISVGRRMVMSSERVDEIEWDPRPRIGGRGA